MLPSFNHKAAFRYWIKVFALYALAEASIQLLFFVVLNYFGSTQISIIEIHFVMWIFQCLLIGPIWWVAWSVRNKSLAIQILVNLGFYFIYSYAWFGPVQDLIGYIYNNLQDLTRAESDRLPAVLDQGDKYSYLNYQLLKHAFRLSWFYMAAWFYNYQLEEKKRIELAIANKELQLRMMKWHLNPSFYFKTIGHLRKVADARPSNATAPILQLAKVMEYVIYEAKERLVSIQKEIHFLNNYTGLLQEQDSRNAFKTTVTGSYDKLRISPLLLTGFIDRVIAGNKTTSRCQYDLRLQFNGKEMQLELYAGDESGTPVVIPVDNELRHRLKEIYPDRFWIANQLPAHTFKFTLLLDEE